MTIRSFGRSSWLVYVLLAAFVVFMIPMGFAATEPNSGALSGFVYAKDVKTPVAGAVASYHPATPEDRRAADARQRRARSDRRRDHEIRRGGVNVSETNA